jgi:predicted DNA-binding protein YlxM (UPF0122 family)
MNELSLFSGAGGGLLGTMLLGFRPIGYVEWDDYCQRVIAARIRDGILPDAPIFGDIRSITKETIDSLSAYWYNTLNSENEEGNMGAHRKDYSEAVRLYDQGLSIGEVADFFHVTRQAMHDILRRRGVVFRDNLRFGEENHFWRGTAANDRAQNILEQALEKRIVIRPEKCEKCGSSGTFKDGRTEIQGHHCDYNKPLDVLWLCQKCHHEWHRNNEAIPYREVSVEPSKVIDIITAGFP